MRVVVAPLVKSCSKCKQTKPHSEFRKSNKGDSFGLHSWCYECCRVARRKSYQDNKEKYQAWNKSWNDNNIEKRREYQQQRDSRTDYNRRWRAEHPEQALAHRHNYRARKREADGQLTAAVIGHIFEIYGKKCLQCGSTDNIQIDHVIPLTLGGSNLFENLQPLCQKHNSSKGNRSCADYREELGEGTISIA